MIGSTGLSAQEQQALRDWFRQRWEHGVAFNRLCGMRVLRWDAGGVEIALPYEPQLSAHEGAFHGGVVSALIDTAGGGAVMADHDFDKGSRLSTVALSVQYVGPARGAQLIAYASCFKRGGRIHYAEVEVRDGDGATCARGQVVVSISGRRPGLGAPHWTPQG